jgi:predicted HAD superfamily Cof-like phosphohydrolase
MDLKRLFGGGSTVHWNEDALEASLLLFRDDAVLMRKVPGTWGSGETYALPACFIKPGGSVLRALANVAAEDLALRVDAEAISLAHVMLHAPGEQGLSLFFTVKDWDGEPTGQHARHASVRWLPYDGLPGEMPDHVRSAVHNYRQGRVFSIYPGPEPWDSPGPSFAARAVTAFHAAFGLPMQTQPSVDVDEGVANLRVSLLAEEAQEFITASAKKDLTGIADALADIVYVVYGTALSYGIDLDRVLREVHRSNMSKLGSDGKPLIREDGKVLKSGQYFRPQVEQVLSSQPPLRLLD